MAGRTVPEVGGAPNSHWLALVRDMGLREAPMPASALVLARSGIVISTYLHLDCLEWLLKRQSVAGNASLRVHRWRATLYTWIALRH